MTTALIALIAAVVFVLPVLNAFMCMDTYKTPFIWSLKFVLVNMLPGKRGDDAAYKMLSNR